MKIFIAKDPMIDIYFTRTVDEYVNLDSVLTINNVYTTLRYKQNTCEGVLNGFVIFE